MDLNQIFSDLFKYATSVIDVVKQATSSIDFDKAKQLLDQQNIKEGIQTGLNIFQQITLWFKNNVGTSIIEILKVIGNAIIWVLEKILSLFKGIVK